MGAYDGLRTFADVKAAIATVGTHAALEALNDAVNDRFWANQQQLTMSDPDWEQMTVLIANKLAELGQGKGAIKMEQAGSKQDYRRELTDKIIRALEAGTAPWQKPWDGNVAQPMMPYNPISKTVYKGGNSIGLMIQGYDDPRWCTYKQAQEQGWQVRRGEKSTTIEFWKFDDERETTNTETGEVTKTRVKLERPQVFYAKVFNARQMDNVPEIDRDHDGYEWEPMEMAERILQRAKVPLFHDQQDRAFYSVVKDEMHMPPREAFADAMRYYSTALHELGHATGHPSRLDRPLGNAFGTVEYAKEELRAEMASLFLSYQLGVPHDVGQHAAYVESWITVLQKDKNELFRAAKDAEQITEYLMAHARGHEQVQAPEIDLVQTRIVTAHQGFAAGLVERFGADIAASGDGRVTLATKAFLEETYGTGDVRQAYNRRSDATGITAVPFSGPIVHESRTHYYQLDEADRTIILHFKGDLSEPLELGKTYSIEKTGGTRSVVRQDNLGREASPRRDEFPTSETSESEEVAPAPRRVYINVPFSEKEQVKALGARWDKGRSSWYVPEELGVGAAEKMFAKWMEVPTALSHSELEKQFHDALVAAKLVIKGTPVMNGEWQRTTVSTSSKATALKGAYIANLDDEVPNGFIQNFDTGYSAPWYPDGLILTDEQRRKYERQAAENKAIRERELADAQDKVATLCAKKWASLPDLESHPYIERKGVEIFGLKRQGDNLVTPVRDVDGKIWSLQYIPADPNRIKMYEKGGRKTGNFHVLGNLEGAETVLFAEGYATCASLHMATQLPVVEVFDSGNIDAVMRALSPRLEGVEKIICADDDEVTYRKLRGALNNDGIKERFKLTDEIREEILVAPEYMEPIPLSGNRKCTLQLSYEFPKEHGGFKRAVGEIVNTETNDRMSFLVNNVGREKAWEAARKYGAKVVAPVFSTQEATEDRGLTDFNDLHKDEGLDQVRTQIAAVADLGRAKGVAVEAAKASIGESVTVTDPRDNQRYVGPVVANAGLHAVQDVGRQTAVAHPIAKLDRVPAVGATARIEYEQGRGKVMETAPARDRANER